MHNFQNFMCKEEAEKVTVIEDLELLTEIGSDLSQQFKGVFIEDQKRTKSTHFLAKALENSYSILKLIPDSKYSEGKQNYIDISSILSLCRNLIELCNIAWYIIEDETSEDEFKLRLDILLYHDYISTEIIFNQLFYDEENEEILRQKAEFYKSKIKENKCFQNLETGTKKLILKGKKSTIFTQFEIVEKRGLYLDDFKAYYKLMSVHTHSSPSSISHLVYNKAQDEESIFGPLITAYLIHYCGSYLASLIKSVTELWGVRFAKIESKNLIEEYAEF